MRKIKLILGVSVLLLVSVQVNAATLHVDGEGFLLGASNVLVGSGIYDVTFREEPILWDFVFTNINDASEASQALLDQVFVGAFDFLLGFTKYCLFEPVSAGPGDAASATSCETGTPYSIESSVGGGPLHICVDGRE